MTLAQREFVLARRSGAPLAVLVVEVTGAEARPGDPMLDRAVDTLVKQLRSLLGPDCMIGRVRPAQIAVVVPGADEARCRDLAEAVRMTFSAPVAQHPTPPVRAAVGFSTLSPDMPDAAGLLARALPRDSHEPSGRRAGAA
jgi:GGDEF domain-containing protein